MRTANSRPFFLIGVVIELDETVERDDEPDDFFLPDFHAASDVGVGERVEPRGFDEVGATHENSRSLRTANPLPATDSDEIGAHLQVTG